MRYDIDICVDSSVLSPKNVIKIVWYIFFQLSALKKTMSLVSG